MRLILIYILPRFFYIVNSFFNYFDTFIKNEVLDHLDERSLLDDTRTRVLNYYSDFISGVKELMYVIDQNQLDKYLELIA